MDVPKLMGRFRQRVSASAVDRELVRRAAPPLALATALVGATVVAGWLLDVAWMRRFAPGEVDMKINTAIALMLGSAAVVLIARGQLRAGRALAAAVAVIGALTLVEFLLGVPLGIDELLIGDPSASSSPGRMSPNMAAALALCATGLLVVRVPGNRAAVLSWTPLGSALIALIALIGYAIGAPQYVGLGDLIHVSLPGAAALLILSLSVAALEPKRGPLSLLTRRSPAGGMARQLLPVAIVLPGLLAALSRKGETAGLYDTHIGVLIMAGGITVVMCAAIGLAGRALDDLERRRRASERRLLEEQRMLAESQAAASVGSWEWDLERGVPRWSEELFRLHGLDPAAGVPDPDDYALLVHPDDRSLIALDGKRTLDESGVVTREYRILHPTRGTRAMQLQGKVMAAEDGRPPRIVGTMRDVTVELEAEAARRAAEEELRQSFEEAIIGMVVFDLDGRFLRVNDAFCAITGHERAHLIGTPREHITHPDDHAGDVEAVRALLDGERSSYVREKRYLHAAGHPVWVSVSVTLVRDAQGESQHFIAQVQDITERRRYEGQLEHMADHDPLTGLPNRRCFNRELEGHIARGERYGHRGAVMMIDLDNFKYYNDTQGHSAGDDLIVRIAQALRERLRDSDVVARLGGDEFAVLLPLEDAQTADRVARSLLEVVREQAASPAVGPLRRVTASIGIACIDGEEGMTAEEVLVNADLAMYEAKEHGRDGLAHYRTEEHSGPRIESRMKWADQIDAALADDGFELFAQPIVAFGAAELPQYELLLRMRGSEGDLIQPGSFLYVAERLGLVQQIDRWVAGRAIDLLAEYRAAGGDVRLEVNLSGKTIGDGELLSFVEERLAAAGVPPDRLVFEVTETAAINHIARASEFAEQLSDLGCRFALDDFGAGFGSFYYLKHLPFDYLKIDGEFVRHCARSETDRILIAGVVEIARGLGTRTIAEFVGDDEAVEVLTRLGVDFGQGYHLGRPAPLDQYLRPGELGGSPAGLRVSRDASAD